MREKKGERGGIDDERRKGSRGGKTQVQKFKDIGCGGVWKVF